MISEIESGTHRISEIFLSFVPQQLDSESFHSLDDEVDQKLPKKQNVNATIEMQNMIRDSITIEIEPQELQLDNLIIAQPNQQTRLIFRGQTTHQPILRKPQIPINITFLYLALIRQNPKIRKYIMLNILADILLRLSILAFFCMEEAILKGVTFLFIIFVQLPRIVHSLTTAKLLLMDQFKLDNRSFLIISNLYRKNFLDEECPREEDLKPINYKDQIVSFRSLLFIVMPIELSFLPLPLRSKDNMINTLIISSYILKSIEVIIFEPSLLILLSIRQYHNEDQALYRHTIFVLILVDIAKYVFLNVYLVLFSSLGKKNKVSL